MLQQVEVSDDRRDSITGKEAEVSVVIPAYNYDRYLSKAIESVLAQTIDGFEVLVVDDGSTDETAAVAKRYAANDSRVRYIHQKNAGLSAARNTGIQAAQTQYVAFLDADDEYAPEFLERALEIFKKLPEDFAVVAFQSQRIGPDSERLPQKNRSPGAATSGEIFRDDVILKNRFPVTAVVKRMVFDQAGEFDTSLRSSEDRDMWIRITSRFRVFHLAEPLASIRIHSANMSRHSDRMRENMKKVLVKAYLEDRKNLFRRLFWLKVASYFHFQNSWMRHEEGRQLPAVCDMLASLILWPCFRNPRSLNEPFFFRGRGLARFLIRPVKRKRP